MPDVGTINVPIPYTDLGKLVSNFVFVAMFGAALFFLVQIIIGGMSWINAGGDPKNLDSARNRITNAVIGLVIVAAAFAVTLIVTSILGLNIFSGTVTIN